MSFEVLWILHPDEGDQFPQPQRSDIYMQIVKVKNSALFMTNVKTTTRRMETPNTRQRTYVNVKSESKGTRRPHKNERKT